jgi:hypothetical protein
VIRARCRPLLATFLAAVLNRLTNLTRGLPNRHSGTKEANVSGYGDISKYLTPDEHLLLKQISDDRKWRDYQRDVLAPRRAAEEAVRREYARAEHAAIKWTGWDTLPAEVLQLQRHYVDLALQEPQVYLNWLSRDTRSQELVGTNNAGVFIWSRKVVAPPIIDRASAVDVGHEIGHCRTPPQGRLQQEVAAWRWSKAHCLFWDKSTQATMVGALQTYTNNAKQVDVLEVLDIEELCSTDEFRREQCRQLQRNLAAERAQLQAQLQGRQCQRCERKAASEIYAGEPTCAKCAATARDDASHRAVDERITRLRQERARLGRPRSQSK